MRHSNVMLATAITSLFATSLLAVGTAEAAKHEAPAVEKCYGIAKAGKNDCQTSTSACAGTAKKDGQKGAWLSVPKGTCEKIVGASLKAGK